MGEALLPYIVTSITGWLMMILLVTTIIYPFLLRKGVLGPIQPFLKRMEFHYWLGYSIATVVLVHALVPMSAGLAKGADAVGLDLATVALLLTFVQVFLGRQLRWPKLPIRRVVRRWHFWVMVGVVALVLGHVALNSGTLQMLLAR